MQRALVVFVIIWTSGCHRSQNPVVGEAPYPINKLSRRPAETDTKVPARETPPNLAATSEAEKGPAPQPIDAAEAVRLAERFVRENGYTDYIPSDLGLLVPESIERFPRKDWLAKRRNTLLPKAYGYFNGSRKDPKGWTIGFQQVTPLNPAAGRGVTMNALGGEICINHSDLNLEMLIKLHN